MDTKHIHCMLEDVAKYGKRMIEEGAGSGNVNLEDAKKVVEMVGELAEAEYHALIAKEMRKSNEEDEAEEKYIRKMLKEENKDEYKRMREEYGEDEGERRFYDNYRYKRSGRFAPKGRGSYMPRRGYEEPPYYHMTPEMMREHDPEYWRDVDRHMGKMYFTPMSGGDRGGQSGSSTSANMGGNAGGSTRGYEDGFNDGNRRGYEDGYRDGESKGRSQGGNSRYERAKRGYEETKEKHKGNTPEDKRMNMAEFEKVLNIVLDEIDDMLEDAPPEMKNMAKTKGMARLQKIS